MKNHIKILLLLAVIGISSIANADSSDPFAKNGQKVSSEQRIEKRIEKMRKNFAISDAQAIEIRTVLTNTKNQMQGRIEKMRSAPASDKAALRNELNSTRLSTHNEILRILTPEQRAKAESLRDAKKAQMKDKRKGNKRYHKQM